MHTYPPIRRPPKNSIAPLPNLCFDVNDDPTNATKRIVHTTDERFGLGRFEIDFDAMLTLEPISELVRREYIRHLLAAESEPSRLPRDRHEKGWPHDRTPTKD